MYRSYSALASLIRFSFSSSDNVYPSFAADGRIFQLRSLAISLGDSCVEKEYFLALVDLGEAVFISKERKWGLFDTEKLRHGDILRAEILDIIASQQYVLSSLNVKIANLTFCVSLKKRRLTLCYRESMRRRRKSFCFIALLRSLGPAHSYGVERCRCCLFRNRFPPTFNKRTLLQRIRQIVRDPWSSPFILGNVSLLVQNSFNPTIFHVLNVFHVFNILPIISKGTKH